MNTSVLRLVGAALIAAGLPYFPSAYAGDHRYVPPKPDSYQAIMAVKMPGPFGPHLPAADIPSTYTPPPTGSVRAIMAVKDPAHYGPHVPAADLPPKSVCPRRADAFAAIMSVKDPAHYGPCGRKPSEH